MEETVFSHLFVVEMTSSSNGHGTPNVSESQLQNVNGSQQKGESESAHKERHATMLTAKGNTKCQMSPTDVTFLLPPPIVTPPLSLLELTFSFFYPPALLFVDQ